MGCDIACNPAAGNGGGDDQFFHVRDLFFIKLEGMDSIYVKSN